MNMLDLTRGSIWKAKRKVTIEIIDHAFIYGGQRLVAVNVHSGKQIEHPRLWPVSRIEMGGYVKVEPGFGETA